MVSFEGIDALLIESALSNFSSSLSLSTFFFWITLPRTSSFRPFLCLSLVIRRWECLTFLFFRRYLIAYIIATIAATTAIAPMTMPAIAPPVSGSFRLTQVEYVASRINEALEF